MDTIIRTGEHTFKLYNEQENRWYDVSEVNAARRLLSIKQRYAGYPVEVPMTCHMPIMSFNQSRNIPVGPNMVDVDTGTVAPRTLKDHWTFTLPIMYPVSDLSDLLAYLDSILSKDDQKVLKNFIRSSLQGKKGEVLQIVGSPGSGKSTLRVVIESALQQFLVQVPQHKVKMQTIYPAEREIRARVLYIDDYEYGSYPLDILKNNGTSMMVFMETSPDDGTNKIKITPTFTPDRLFNAGQFGDAMFTWLIQ